MGDIFLFGDQTANPHHLLRNFTLERDNAVLSTFLERASVALREETRRLPSNSRAQIPDFLTVADLLDAYAESNMRIPELESSLVTISQVAHYMRYHEAQSLQTPSIENTRTIASCTGLLAAAVVVSAKSLSELIPLGVEATRISFRLGTCVGTAKSALVHGQNDAGSWSTVVTGMSEEAANTALDQFHSSTGITSSSKAYISAVSHAAVTISGPPTTTQRFFDESDISGKNHRLALPIYAPYHARHLFDGKEVDRIIDTHSRHLLAQFQPVGIIHSASSGKVHIASTTLELMEIVADEILREPVRWDLLLEETVLDETLCDQKDSKIVAFGITNATSSLASALKAGNQRNVTVIDHTTLMANNHKNNGRTNTDKIAIVGMAGRFPDAANHERLWNLLLSGLDVHKEVPKDRFDATAHCDPSGKGKNQSHTPYGCFIDEPGLFDPRFFNMSPREAAQTDPMGRLALVTAYEALEMSGYVPNRTPSTKLHRVGTFYGQTSDDWREINAAENIDTYFITGGVRAFAPGRINYYFKFSGPSFSIDTACSSSLAAIQLACTSLWAGDCDTACAGGLNVLTNPDIFAGLSKGQFLSKTGSCKTYDNDADGYCRGDGCGTVILKRYQDAVADKDNILGCILGAATNHSAEAVSITHPHAGAQEFLYKKVLADAGIDANDVTYVEMHGTGTQAGDGVEMTSVTNVFAPSHRRRRLDQPLYLGAIKANIGHGEAASGINSLIKVMMMMREDQIPPNVGIKGVLNKGFPKDLLERNVHIPLVTVPMPRHGSESRKIFLNNFSAAGGNTALLLEDHPPNIDLEAMDPRSTHIVTVTARAISSLKKNINNLIEYLERYPTTTLQSLAYTTTARRIHHNYRIAFCVTDISQVKKALQSSLRETYSPVALASTPIAFAFTGQGSQYTGLGQKLYDELKSFKTEIEQLDSLVCLQGFPSILPLLNGADVAKLSPVVVQLGLVCIQVAFARIWASWGVKPVAVIGHSLGEYAALNIAGVISASDMIYLVGKRAEILVSNCTASTHGMLAIKGGEDAIFEALGSTMIEVACKNGPEETVLCGSNDEIEAAATVLNSRGFKTTKLNVPFAFHSAQVDPILAEFTSVANSVAFGKPLVPVLSPVDGEVISEAGTIGPGYLARHARQPVDFLGALKTGEANNTFNEKTAWLEIGAHPVCCGMIKASLGNETILVHSLRRGEDPWKTISNAVSTLYLSGAAIDFDEYHREFNDAHQLLTLPTYSFDNKNYWLDYHNNWCLSKGESPDTSARNSPAAEPVSKLSTTSCQRIVSEELLANTGLVVVQSNLAEPKLFAVVSGHLVNDVALCPSTLYADMALTTCDYLYRQLRPNAPKIGINVCKMEVPKPLVAKMPSPPEGQYIQVEARADLDQGSANLKFRSVTPEGTLIQEHAHCIVKFENIENWLEDWNMAKFMVQTQIDLLKQKLHIGAAHKVLRGMAYKLFKALVTYDDKFRGMEEIIMDGKETEGTALVHFQANESDGDFYCSPYWIDSLCHITGFLVNASDLIDSDLNVFISHGWGSLRLSRPFSAEKKYRSYVRMQSQPKDVRAGDVYIFEGEEIVGVVSGVKFQQIPRRVLNTFLPPSKGRANALAAAPVRPVAITQPIAASKPKMSSAMKKTLSNVKPPARRANVDGLIAKVMEIIAAETDVNMTELVDEAAFENLGVDSLLSLTISAKFREDLELEVSSTLFIDNPTVGHLKRHFSKYKTAASLEFDSDSDSSSYPSDVVTPDTDEISTPPSSAPSVTEEKPLDHAERAIDGSASIARQIVAEEMGVGLSEVADQADLAEMGMDSLMSLTVLSALRERTGIELPATFLVTNNTIEDIENALGMRPRPNTSERPRVLSKPSSEIAPLQAVNVKLQISQKDVSKCPLATSVLLQGNPRTATKKFFLFPDGSGSATSYISIPSVGRDTAVYGLNCPFMKNPSEFVVGIDGVSTLYINEMKRRQPTGPYYVGGWSAGGVVAYEVACQLMARGENIEKLILIDSPCPVNLEPLPARLHHFFDQIGLLGSSGTGSSPDWLLTHFERSIIALSEYKPQPMPEGRAPSTLAIWAREGVCGNPGDPRPPPAEGEDPKPMKWLLDNRTDFGDNGWAQLLGIDAMAFVQMDGNHFTMMREEHTATLGRLIKQGLS